MVESELEYELRCGDVYCDRCGDCIYCYGDDPCYDEGDHLYELPDPKELEK